MEIQQKRITWFTTIAMVFFLALNLWQDYKRNQKSLGYYLLGLSILITIAGIGMSFSKKERERIRKQLVAELPDRASLIEYPDADKKTRRRGYILAVVGIILFITWLKIYGFLSLSSI
jgi:hypothetical protein